HLSSSSCGRLSHSCIRFLDKGLQKAPPRPLGALSFAATLRQQFLPTKV
ncbi:hypothetical protein PoMZ_01367, partial [Pyricularia oryzae]